MREMLRRLKERAMVSPFSYGMAGTLSCEIFPIHVRTRSIHRPGFDERPWIGSGLKRKGSVQLASRSGTTPHHETELASNPDEPESKDPASYPDEPVSNELGS